MIIARHIAATTAVMALTLMLPVTPAGAEDIRFSVIDFPTDNYLSSTCRFDIDSIPNRQRVKELPGCGGALRFNDQMRKGTVPDQWPFWNSPPDVESATPSVLISTSPVHRIKVPRSTIVGLEIQPSAGFADTVTVLFSYADGRSTIIQREINGPGDAQVIGLKVRNAKIVQVSIGAEASPRFAIANVRIASAA